MTTLDVNWGDTKVKLTWIPNHTLPQTNLITSVHGMCFQDNQLLFVYLPHRGWDFPGGHIELDESPEECFKREALEEGSVEGDCKLLGYIEVVNPENPLSNPKSPYPKIGYQVFYRMDIKKLLSFDEKYESTKRIFIDPKEVSEYHHNWHKIYQEILDHALTLSNI